MDMKKGIPAFYKAHLERRHKTQLSGVGVSIRALIVGVMLVLVVSLGAPYSIWIVGSSEITWSYFPIGVGGPFFLLILVNALVKRWYSAWALMPAELITVLLMGLAASGIPVFIVGYIISIIANPYYGALPQNQWVEYVQPYLPAWAIPATTDKAIRYFYESLPITGQGVPWMIWLGPMLWWLSLILCIYFLCLALVVVLRRHWVERERLVFPLAEIPLMLVAQGEDDVLPRLWHSWTFWIGVAVPLSVIGINTIGYFFPGAPGIPIHGGWEVALLPAAPKLLLLIYFPVIGFTYLVGTTVSFSIWFFYLLTLIEISVLSQVGWKLDYPEPFVWSGGAVAWQSWGAFVAMVLLSLWVGRQHIWAVISTVWNTNQDLDDRDEMLSYPVAVIGGLVSVSYILIWLCWSGMSLPLACLYLVGALIIFLGITRLVIQSGMHYVTTPMASQSLVLAVTGSGIGPPALMGLALSYAWCGDVQSIFMPSAAHAARLGGLYERLQSRGLVLALGLAVIVAFIASSVMILHLCYHYGAVNLRSWFFNAGGGCGWDGI